MKTFAEMVAVDVSQHVKEHDGVKYLPWAACLRLLYEQGAKKVIFFPVPGPDGTSLHYSNLSFTDSNDRVNRCYEVVVHIQVDNEEWETTYPVLNGKYAVKDNTLDQLKVSNAVRRAFVKGVAERLGLGLSLWEREEESPEENTGQEDGGYDKEAARKRMSYLQELITKKLKSGLEYGLILSKIGLTPDEAKELFSAEEIDIQRINDAIEILKKWGNSDDRKQ